MFKVWLLIDSIILIICIKLIAQYLMNVIRNFNIKLSLNWNIYICFSILLLILWVMVLHICISCMREYFISRDIALHWWFNCEFRKKSGFIVHPLNKLGKMRYHTLWLNNWWKTYLFHNFQYILTHIHLPNFYHEEQKLKMKIDYHLFSEYDYTTI